jgi:glutamate racemase
MLGIFDSGLGGLTVARALEQKFPAAGYIYYGDTARLPYGTKTPETIGRYTVAALEHLQVQGASTPVIACHTASSTLAAHPDIRDQALAAAKTDMLFDVVTPAVAAARAATREGRIGILGTAATVRSGIYETLLHDAEVTQVPASVLVGLAEEGWTSRHHAGPILKELLLPFMRARVDTVVLACTHFPLLAESIHDILGPEVALVNPGVALVETLAQHHLPLTEGPKRYFASDLPADFAERASRFLGRPVDAEQL